MQKSIWIVAVCIAGLSVATTAAAAGAMPGTLAQALEGAALDTREGWSFRKTMTVDAMNEPAVVTVTRWNPSKPAGEQCSVISVEVKGVAGVETGDDDPCEDGHEREVYGDLVALLDDAVIETAAETETAAEYRITPRDKQRGFRMGGMHVDIDEEDAERLEGKVTVAKTGAGAPYVERVDFLLSEPAGNLLAKLRRLDVSYRYSPDPATGVKLMSGMTLDLELRLFTLFNVTAKVTTHYDDFRRLP